MRAVTLSLAMLACMSVPAASRDGYGDRPLVCDPATVGNVGRCQQWIENAKMPDNREVSCCGVGDAFIADSIETGKKGELYAVLNSRFQRYTNIPREMRILIPPNKVNIAALDGGNPTGSIVVFMIWISAEEYTVYCFFGPTLS